MFFNLVFLWNKQDGDLPYHDDTSKNQQQILQFSKQNPVHKWIIWYLDVMKLRIRLQNRRQLIEVPNADCTVRELIAVVDVQFSLIGSIFGLSLDGKTLLPTDENTTISDLGIVGGDLLHILLDSSSIEGNSSGLPSNNAVNQSITSQVIDTSNASSIDMPSTSDTPSTDVRTSSINHKYKERENETVSKLKSVSTCNKGKGSMMSVKTESEGHKDVEHQRPGPSIEQKQLKLEYAPKVLLCRDGMPYSLQSSYEIGEVVTMHEAVCVAVHVLMLETGFINYNSEATETLTREPSSASSQDNTNSSSSSAPIISQTWKTSSGARFSYVHPACPGLVSSVVCTSLGPFVLAHGMSNSPSCHEVHQCRLAAADFVKGNVDLKSSSAVDVYKNLQRLSMAVKDQLAYPLLSSLRHELNLEEIYGFMALPTEVKLMVLCLLPVKDILQMSATCRELQTITNDSILWQQLCFRDFKLLTKGKYTTWKMEYKRRYKDYMERKQDSERMTFVVPGQGMYDPPMFPGPYSSFTFPGMHGGRQDLFPNVPFMPGGINPGTLPTPGNLPHPRFDPYGPVPDMDINPGHRRGRPGRGRGRGGLPPGPFF